MFVPSSAFILPWSTLRQVYGCGHSMGAAALIMRELQVQQTFHSLLLVEPILFPMDRATTGPHALADRTIRRRTTWYCHSKVDKSCAVKFWKSVADAEARELESIQMLIAVEVSSTHGMQLILWARRRID
jgi:hypothetical protein